MGVIFLSSFKQLCVHFEATDQLYDKNLLVSVLANHLEIQTKLFKWRQFKELFYYYPKILVACFSAYRVPYLTVMYWRKNLKKHSCLYF